jgi:hypothetical protein
MQEVKDGVYQDVELFDTVEMLKKQEEASNNGSTSTFEVVPVEGYEQAKARVGQLKIVTEGCNKRKRRRRSRRKVVCLN